MCDLIVNKSAYNKSLITFWTDLAYRSTLCCRRFAFVTQAAEMSTDLD